VERLHRTQWNASTTGGGTLIRITIFKINKCMKTIYANICGYVKEVNSYLKASAKSCAELSKASIDKLTVNPDRGYVYAFVVDGKIVYVGKSKSKYLKSRLNAHLKGSKGTGSKHKEVKKAGKGNVTFAVIEVCPSSVRSVIEEELIAQLNPKWNIHETKK
jgi:hypothetical protein